MLILPDNIDTAIRNCIHHFPYIESTVFSSDQPSFHCFIVTLCDYIYHAFSVVNLQKLQMRLTSIYCSNNGDTKRLWERIQVHCSIYCHDNNSSLCFDSGCKQKNNHNHTERHIVVDFTTLLRFSLEPVVNNASAIDHAHHNVTLSLSARCTILHHDENASLILIMSWICLKCGPARQWNNPHT